ncbi:site-specific integrase [Paracoccus benzoatiresistens]|uniref:Tyrosine-type recombinase/integrase n=1 Tax=Paracoccus benzoatiresistens TaxID=2997341 RepID=A0ABT4JBG8_9RHOB|nr:tyrosine-type recombinase/integrase [Paracoccus sp. EF6]MCZ0964442.1 tyrosine-type recombinase/integrase [Paracoccus sp. EF6]
MPGKHMLRLNMSRPAPLPQPGSPPINTAQPNLSECVATYIRFKGAGKSKTFQRAAERSCGYVIDICSDKALNDYTRKDANALRDALVSRGMAGSSITRIFGTVRAVTNFAASEEGITLTNPSGGVYYDRTAGVVDRLPIPVDNIRKIQTECYRLDDEIRWLVALVADTGMRLAEAAGLLCEDIVHDDDGYHVHIRAHPWRRLKTASSTRTVPLVGSSAWTAQRILAARSSGFAFPRYNKTGQTNANAASATLNKWVKPYDPKVPQCTDFGIPCEIGCVCRMSGRHRGTNRRLADRRHRARLWPGIPA